MKKTVKPRQKLVVDEYQQIYPSKQRPVKNINNKRTSKQQKFIKNIDLDISEDYQCQICGDVFSKRIIGAHEKICRMSFEEKGVKYEKKESLQKPAKKKGTFIHESNQYYFDNRQQTKTKPQKNNSKRPMSALSREVNPSKQKKKQQTKILTKVTSTSKLKNMPSLHHREEKSLKNNQKMLKNSQRLNLSQYRNIKNQTQKLRKKKMISKPINIRERQEITIERKAPQIKIEKRQLRFQQEDDELEYGRINRPRIQRSQHPPPQRKKQVVRQRRQFERQRQQERPRREEIPRNIRQENARNANRQNNRRRQRPFQHRVPRENHQTEQPNPPRQRRQNNRPRNNRRQQQNPNNQNPSAFMDSISSALNNNFSLINNQFNMMSNMFENISNYVNINIETYPQRSYVFQFNNGEGSSQDQYSFSTSEEQSRQSDYSYDYSDQQEKRGLDEYEIDMIPTTKCKQGNKHQCTVCMMDIGAKQYIKKLICDHIFHKQCIDQWLIRKADCPVCREKVVVQ